MNDCCRPQKNETTPASTCGSSPPMAKDTDFNHLTPFAVSPSPAACAPSEGIPKDDDERAGYRRLDFVERFMTTAAGPVPVIRTTTGIRDRIGTLLVRLGVGRDGYAIAPGLYAVGKPEPSSPVLVTANYKLTLDHLRCALAGKSAWILVLNTRGINVWCAAGKGTFGTAEIIRQVKQSQVADVVDHRRLILPQLGATGVQARTVKRETGFEVSWGPILARDLPAYLDAGEKATADMRRVTFTLTERVVLIPVELTLLKKNLHWAAIVIFLLSGIGPDFFSITAAWHRGLSLAGACLAGILAGAAATPALLPLLPGSAFSVKGAVAGIAAGLAVIHMSTVGWLSLQAAAMMIVAVAIASFLAMNFTGSTPFTSPSGVEKEMRRAIPVQAGATIVSAILWVWSGFPAQ